MVKDGMYLNKVQAAHALKMSRVWLDTLISRGEIGTSKIGGRHLVIEDDRFKEIQRQRVDTEKWKKARKRNGAKPA